MNSKLLCSVLSLRATLTFINRVTYLLGLYSFRRIECQLLRQTRRPYQLCLEHKEKYRSTFCCILCKQCHQSRLVCVLIKVSIAQRKFCICICTFGSFGNEPMQSCFVPRVSLSLAPPVSASASASSVYSCYWDSFDHRNFIPYKYMQICP